ncbi:MAG: MetQ/NlpA family ABC transporter substrate-binding protein [Vagococcus sp.]
MKQTTKWVVLLLAVVTVIAGCSKGETDKESKKDVVKLGVIGSDTDVWDDVKERLTSDGIELEYVKFTDYNQPNAALEDGSIDINSFQHQFFLDNYNKEHGTELVSIGNTVNAPLGIYSEKIKKIEDLADEATIAIPNDVTNGGRSLLLLQTAGLIKVDPSKGQTPTVSDITENKKNLVINELDASQTARSLQDVEAAIINSGVAVDAGFVPDEDAIFLEPVADSSKPYVNIIVTKKENKDKELYKKVVEAYQTDATKKVIEKTSKGSSVPAWETFGKN